MSPFFSLGDLYFLTFLFSFFLFLSFLFFSLQKINFLTPSRRLIRDESLTQLADGKKKVRTVFLFTDLFVIAKEGGGMMSVGSDKLKVVDMVPLDAALIHDPEPGMF